MEINWSIIGWIAGLVFVYLFGLFEGRAKGYKKRKKEEQEEKKNQPPPKPETVTETITVKVDDPGLLRIKNEDGSFALDLDGARVNPISLSPEQRKRLIEILGMVRPWLEGRSAPVADVRQGAPAAPASPPPSSTAQTPPAVVPIQPASPPPQPSPKPATIAKEDRPAAPANSIVTQIDSILQARLVGTPLAERGVFLTQSLQGGVSVYVGLTRYDGVDAVPDPEVKAAIRAAITEWEDKYTPGL